MHKGNNLHKTDMTKVIPAFVMEKNRRNRKISNYFYVYEKMSEKIFFTHFSLGLFLQPHISFSFYTRYLLFD